MRPAKKRIAQIIPSLATTAFTGESGLGRTVERFFVTATLRDPENNNIPVGIYARYNRVGLAAAANYRYSR